MSKRNDDGYYLCPDGIKRKSVTTYLKVIAKDALVPWAAKMERERVMQVLAEAYVGRREYWGPDLVDHVRQKLPVRAASEKALETASDIGQTIHNLLEKTMLKLLGVDVVWPEDAMPIAVEAAKQLLLKLDEIKFRPLLAERFVWSADFDFAGTLDAFGEITLPDGRGVQAIGDYKSGKAIYPEAVLQLAAYRKALMDEMELSSPETWGFIARASKDPEREPELLLLSPEQLDSAFHGFMAAQHLSLNLDTVKKIVKPPKTKKAPKRKKAA